MIRATALLACMAAAAGPAFLAAQTLSFPEGASTTRSVAENAFAGVNVGSPVSAVGSGSLAYTLGGTDAGSFSILAGTGQIRTKDGVTYDYETKDRYSVTVGAEDGSGNTDTIAVAIEIEDLGPSCMAPPDFRATAGNRSVSVNWTPLEDTEGHARVWGYQIEMRRGSNGIWGTARTLLGREVTGTAYTGLLNASPHQFRIRPLQAEGDCDWLESEIVRPQVPQRAPRDPDEHFRRVGRRLVGMPERNYRFLSPDRCRHTAGGSTLDATCRYASTGPSSATITLEFDDPSQPGCDVSLAYSSLTAGSFHDECFGAGVRVAVDFDTSFRLLPLPDEEERDVPRAPRSQEEFDVLAWGRDDLIPGLGFGLPPMFVDRSYAPGHAYRVEWSEEYRAPLYTLGTYTYQSSGPSQGILTYKGDLGETFVFTLDFLPSGRMQVTVTDPDGGSPGWPGMPDTLLEGSSLPVLLPIPPSWSAAIEIETDVAPENFDALWGRIPTPPEQEDRVGLVESLLLGDIWDRITAPDVETALSRNVSYRKIGRNRASVTITWFLEDSGELTPLQQYLVGSTWVFDIRFRTEDSGTFELAITREGDPPVTLRRFLDLKFGSSSTDTFPDELTLPDEAPQASGQDITGVEIAPVTTPAGIGQNDIQTFLVHNAGSQPASYAPGDWLEPKDGGNQRMMVVASGPPATTGPAAQAQPAKLREPAMPARLGSLAELLPYRPPGSPPPPRQQSMNPARTQISAVCMQLERDVPVRGARYFSQPKTAEGEVQLCQKNCATAGGDAIQRCVWDCETNPSRARETSSFTLHRRYLSPAGIVFANNRLFVPDGLHRRVHAYSTSGRHQPLAGFYLDLDNLTPGGITFANNRFFVVERFGDFIRGLPAKVYAYSRWGVRDPTVEFSLQGEFNAFSGITFANNRFFVVGSEVQAYSASGQPELAANFYLDNYCPEGITFANNRFFVVDACTQKVYAYSSSGGLFDRHEPEFDFDLHADNESPEGITFANNRFFVVDDAGHDLDAGEKIYVYAASGTPTNQGAGSCSVGALLSPGQSCTHSSPGNSLTFSVRDDGFGCIGSSICAGRSLTINNFSATKQADGRWQIIALP